MYDETQNKLDLENNTNQLLDKLDALINDAEKVSIFTMIPTYKRLKEIKKNREKLSAQYDSLLQNYHEKMQEPVMERSLVMSSFKQSWRLSIHTSFLLRLQSSWQRLNNLIDMKTAYSLAILSIYLSAVSFIATVLFGVYTLK